MRLPRVQFTVRRMMIVDDSVAVFVGHLESHKSDQATAKMVRRSKAIASVAGSLRPFTTQNPYLPAPRSSSGSARR
jgi:hypothetical protein